MEEMLCNVEAESDVHIHFCAPACAAICYELQHCVCNCVQHSVCTQDSGRVCVQDSGVVILPSSSSATSGVGRLLSSKYW